ncbi:methyltransferase [Aetokthonos hydrillicola CCALA 1050]|nr:methyltransferase [Aetokthonos hydrillicola CCALA 1050]
MPPQTAIKTMVSSYWISQCIYVAAKLGIADLLKEGERHCEDIAVITGTNKDTLYRLLRALASIGIFAETQPHYFQLTPLGASLQSNCPNSTRNYALLLGEEFYQAWLNLMHSIQTGKNAFEDFYGMNLFEYYQKNPTAGQIFNQAMTDFSAAVSAAVLAAYDFSSIGKLVDVGGSNGSLLAAILQANPTMTGVVFDLPNVIDKAQDFLEQAGVSNRCQLVAGDFFESVPVGGDMYILKHIVHNWDWERASKILTRCYEAMTKQSKLLLIEQIISSGNEPCVAKLWDMHMLVVCPGGSERTEAEYRDLLKSTGFTLNKIIPTQSDVSLIEAVK